MSLGHGHAEGVCECRHRVRSEIFQDCPALSHECLESRFILAWRREIEPNQLEHRFKVLGRCRATHTFGVLVNGWGHLDRLACKRLLEIDR